MLQIQPLQLWSGGLREPSGFVWAHGLAAPIGAEPPRRFTGGAKRIGRVGLRLPHDPIGHLLGDH